ncbi:hypothetical protein RBA41_21330 [Massilia sp. CCM 9210]|uniref:hypothetical protein n=1 Tax=Massilia scottii TaxID=3057166 RepID=UPI002796761F|nr:hypothetical protein [Massilia sp. CCM 9210]MDQ1815843.1 hypothetical protein [Massilia sp. CCM 9210]
MLISISFRIFDVRGSHANLEINASDETISPAEQCFRTLPHSKSVFPNGMEKWCDAVSGLRWHGSKMGVAAAAQ